MSKLHIATVSTAFALSVSALGQQVACPRPAQCEFEAYSSASFGAVGGSSTSQTDLVISLPASSTSAVGDSVSGDGASANIVGDLTTNLQLVLSAQASRGGPFNIPTRSAIATGIARLRDTIYVTGIQAPSGALSSSAIVRVTATVSASASESASVGSAVYGFNLSGFTYSLPSDCFGLNGIPGFSATCSRSVENGVVLSSLCTGLANPVSSGPQLVTFDLRVSNGVPLSYGLQLQGSASASMEFAPTNGTARADYNVVVTLINAEVLAACVNSSGQIVPCTPLQPVQYSTFESRRSLSVFRFGSCDSIDFNNNGIFPEDQDVIDLFSVLEGGSCSTASTGCGCNDIDFNNNGIFPEDQDVLDFFAVVAGGSCP